MELWIFVYALCIVMLLYTAVKSKRIKNHALISAYKISYFPQQKAMLIIMLVILGLIAGLRFETGGTDYFVYEKVYKSLPTLKLFFTNFKVLDAKYITFGHEKGWLFLMSLAKSLRFSYNVFLFCHSLFFFSCLYKFIKRFNVNPILTVLLFMYMMYFYNSMVSLRQSTTIGIFFLSLSYLQNRKIMKYLFCVAIAITIHRASLILIVPYIVYAFKPNKKFLIVFLYLSIPLLILSILKLDLMGLFSFLTPTIDKILGPTTAMKFEKIIANGGESINILHSLQYVLVLFAIVNFYDFLMDYNKKLTKLAIIMMICLYPILIIFRNYEIFTRLKDYFVLFYGVILGMMCYIRNGKYAKIIVTACILICTWGYFRYIIKFDDGHFINYQSIFDAIFKIK